MTRTGETDDRRAFSPSALNRFLACEHRTYLDILERRGEMRGLRLPPDMSLLFERGDRHEDAVVAGLAAEGLDIVALEDRDATVEERARRTIAAMREGRGILHQGCFARDGWLGYPDFLIRIDKPSDLGAWSYEVYDAKLGSHPQPRHIFQLLFYTDELERLQGRRPERMHLMLGDGTAPAFVPDDFAAYAARVRVQFEDRFAELAGLEPDPAYPYKVSECQFCHWWKVCNDRRRADDHVSLVANLHRGQGLKLEAAGIHTVGDLAGLDEAATIPRLTRATLGTLQAQASIQIRSRPLSRPLYELLKPEAERGLARLPEPSAGDVSFDFEGDPYWGEDGLEYLFGTAYEDDGKWRYWPLWATTRGEEKHALEQWLAWITDRLDKHPDLHVFHFNAYEPTALKKLVARHAVGEYELDELLRRKVLVDLYGISRQAIRAGVESYSLKALEPVIDFERDAELRGAIGSLRRWQAWQDDGEQKHLDGIAGYNEDDCAATWALYRWLLDRRPEAEHQYGIELGSLQPEPPKAPTAKLAAYLAGLEVMRPRLLTGLPDDESEDTELQRAVRTTFDLLGYHRREARPAYWAIFDRRSKSLAQLRDEDPEALAGLQVIEETIVNNRITWQMRFPEQEYKLGPGNLDDPLAERPTELLELDEAARLAVVTRTRTKGDNPPLALGPGWPYTTDAQVAALFRFADRVASVGVEPCGRLDAGTDILLRRRPRLRPGTPPLVDEPIDLDRLKAQVRGLDSSVLVVQGPPGTGKTWTGARLAVDLLGRNLRVGVAATSHKAINNMLAAIDEAADEVGAMFRGWKKSGGEEDAYDSDRVMSNKSQPSDDEGPIPLIGATAWHWAAEGQHDSVDVLFIDEAGQVSLADAIAISQGTKSIVLLGDPQQLAHVSQGTHPLDSGASVLEHLLGDLATMPPDLGMFLDTSWRMHPEICDFVSSTMYDSRLSSVAGLERQRVDSPGLCGSGLRMLAVDHLENRGRSTEEVQAIADQVDKLLKGTWTDRHGVVRQITLDDILIVAPYNEQVRCLRSAMPDARIGTVDKFQGQEAPVVFFSMAASTGEDVNRGMSFLFSRNRLNVAVSRAQALSVVVCSPRLLSARCNSVADMCLANMLCRFAAQAEAI
jgi:predicted RecB family nuclease